MQNISRQAARLHLLLYVHKELTNSLVLTSYWLSNIRVWFGLTKRNSEKKVTIWPAKFLSFYKSLDKCLAFRNKQKRPSKYLIKLTFSILDTLSAKLLDGEGTHIKSFMFQKILFIDLLVFKSILLVFIRFVTPFCLPKRLVIGLYFLTFNRSFFSINGIPKFWWSNN